MSKLEQIEAKMKAKGDESKPKSESSDKLELELDEIFKDKQPAIVKVFDKKTAEDYYTKQLTKTLTK